MAINSFSQFLVEEEKTVFFTFGRMNPPTAGHGMMLDKLAKAAGRNPYRIYLSQSYDAKKNPLNYKTKVKFVRKMFPKHARSVLLNNKVKNAMDAAVALYAEGFRKMVMVVGSDRVNEFNALLNKYNGKDARHGFYNFKEIKVISAGARDPDAEGISGVSATKQRTAAADNDFAQFGQGLPASMSQSDAKALFKAIRTGLKLKEETSFTKHVALEPVSETREAFVQGKLYSVGDEVIIKETQEVGTITVLGTNYIIVEANGYKSRKWLDAVEPIEEACWDGYKQVGMKNKGGKQVPNCVPEKTTSPQDPDIKDRKGTQPKAYHKGVKKSTKAARDAHFKKGAKMDDDNPAAYKKAPGDATAKTKPSKHTKRFKQMFGDD